MEEREQQRERVHPEAVEEGPEEKADRATGECTIDSLLLSPFALLLLVYRSCCFSL